jgi:hypothetical protein
LLSSYDKGYDRVIDTVVAVDVDRGDSSFLEKTDLPGGFPFTEEGSSMER